MVQHNKENQQYLMPINNDLGIVEYTIRNGKMFLVHSEVPYKYRGQGFGKILVEKTFEKLTEEGYRAVAVCSYIKAVAKRSVKWNSIIE